MKDAKIEVKSRVNSTKPLTMLDHVISAYQQIIIGASILGEVHIINRSNQGGVGWTQENQCEPGAGLPDGNESRNPYL